mgnify:CR=1 FL=1
MTVAWSQVSAGNGQSCATSSDSKLFCWGYNTNGKLGDGTTTSRGTPAAVSTGAFPANATVRQVASGGQHTCALASDNKVYCWGLNTNGQLGNNTTTSSNLPVAVVLTNMPANATVQQITAGANHTCAIASDDKAYCWGLNTNGQLGDTTTAQKPIPTLVAQGSTPALSTIVQISAGTSHTCAIASDSKAYCWGLNTNGQLGDNTVVQKTTPALVVQGNTPLNSVFSQISAGGSHTCGIVSDSKAYCWGLNTNGQLGDTTTAQKNAPTVVVQGGTPLNSTILQISAGTSSTCAVASDNKSYCWGLNTNGQLGDNTTAQKLVPTAVSQGATPLAATILQVTSGAAHTCEIASDRNVYCWGDVFGASPSLVPGATPATYATNAITGQQISLGESYSCSIASDNKAYCWGFNGSGQLGDGTTTTRTAPVAVAQGAFPIGSTILQITGGGNQACAIASDLKAYCWGGNAYGQLGNGTTTASSLPVAVSPGAIPAGVGIKQIAAGGNALISTHHTCALGSNGKVYCWGRNASGQLGDTTTANSSVPVAVAPGVIPAGMAIRQISVGANHTCAISMENKAYCWGANGSGQLGDTTTSQRTSPVLVTNGVMTAGTTFRSINAGFTETCAIASNNSAYCWGYNNTDQLGNGGSPDRRAPDLVLQGDVPAGTKFRQVTAGNGHTCAIAADNKAYCWGLNTSGQTGSGTTTVTYTIPELVVPGTIPAGVTMKYIVTPPGGNHTCAIGSDNKVYCWGSGSGIGNGGSTLQTSPATTNVFYTSAPTTINRYYF